MGKQWKQCQTLFWGAPKSLQTVTAAMKLKDAYSLEGKLWPTSAKSLQSCPTLCDPTDGSPSGSPIPGILQARTLEWVAISSSNAWQWKVKVKLLSRARLLVTPWTAAYQAPPSMGFSRQEYWTNLDSILKNRDITLPTKVHLVKAMVFPVVGVRIGLWRKLIVKELMLLNCGAGEDSWESLGLQGGPTSPS